MIHLILRLLIIEGSIRANLQDYYFIVWPVHSEHWIVDGADLRAYQQWAGTNNPAISLIKKPVGQYFISPQNANCEQYPQSFVKETSHIKWIGIEWDGPFQASVPAVHPIVSDVPADDKSFILHQSSYEGEQNRMLVPAQRYKYVYGESGAPAVEEHACTIRVLSITVKRVAL